jgi:hypothetical protein
MIENPPQNQNEQKSEFDFSGNYRVRAVGKTAGPTKKSGQQTFVVVLGLFTEDGQQAVHTKADGTKVPIVLTSYPIDTDDRPIDRILL